MSATSWRACIRVTLASERGRRRFSESQPVSTSSCSRIRHEFAVRWSWWLLARSTRMTPPRSWRSVGSSRRIPISSSARSRAALPSPRPPHPPRPLMDKTATAARPKHVVVPPEDPIAESRRAKDFTWFWRAYTVSIFGDQVTLVALPIAVFTRTHSALAVGIAASMQAATTLIFGLFAGALADRMRHRPVLILTDLVRAGVLGFLALMVASSSAYPVAAVYVAAFLLGAFGVLHDATAGAALPVIVSGRELLRANGRLSGSESVGNA